MRQFLFILLLAAPLLSFAQQPAAAPAAAPVTRAPKGAYGARPKVAAVYKAAAPEERGARLSQQLSQQLGLDAATTAKVQAAAVVRAQKIDVIQTGTATNKAKNTALQANAQDFKTALKGILTPEQFAKYAHNPKIKE